HGMIPPIPVREMAGRNKRVRPEANAKVEPDRNVAATEGQSNAGGVTSSGWQRRPAKVTATRTPANPGRSPARIRPPDPVVSIVVPATIMERRPTPRVVGSPVPAAVRVNPVAAFAIRP